jgi:hypothetical protein
VTKQQETSHDHAMEVDGGTAQSSMCSPPRGVLRQIRIG